MTNILQQSEQLKDVSDDRITQEMQQPTGMFPLFLVSSEAKRRADMRSRFRAEQAEPPQTTVQQDLLAALAQQMAGPGLPNPALGGVATNMQPPMPQQMPQQMAQAPRLPGPGPQGMPGGVQQMADGGLVRGFANGSGNLVPAGIMINPRTLPRAATGSGRLAQEAGAYGLKLVPTAPEKEKSTVWDSFLRKMQKNKERSFRLKAKRAGYDIVSDAVHEDDTDERFHQVGDLSFAPVTETPTIAPAASMDRPLDLTASDTGDFMTMPRAVIAPLTAAEKAQSLKYRRDISERSGIMGAASGAQKRLDAHLDTARPTLGQMSLPPRKEYEGEVVDPDAHHYERKGSDAVLGTKGFESNAFKAKQVSGIKTLTSDVDEAKAKKLRLAELRGEADPFSALRERLDKRDAQIEKDSKQNVNMALIEAGLGILGGTSPHAMVNVARADKGVQSFVEGKKDISRRQDAQFDSRMLLTKADQDRDFKLREIAGQYAKGLVSREQRDNAMKQAHNANRRAVHKINSANALRAHTASEAGRLSAYTTGQRAELERYKLKVQTDLRLEDDKARAKESQGKFAEAKEIRARADHLRLEQKRIDDAILEQKNTDRKVLAKQSDYDQRTRRLEGVAERASKRADTVRTREFTAEQAALTRESAERRSVPAAIQLTREAMADPEFKRVYTEMGVGAKQGAALQKSLQSGYQKTLTSFLSANEGLPKVGDTRGWGEFKSQFHASLSGLVGLTDGLKDAYVDSVMKRLGGPTGTAGRGVKRTPGVRKINTEG